MTLKTMPGRRLRSRRTPTGINATPEVTATYKVWTSLMVRHRKHQGRRNSTGPLVDARWVESFDAFYEDAGPAPAFHAIHPVDPGKPIGSDNFRWVYSPRMEQRTRPRKTIVINGHEATIEDWAQRAGISPFALRTRLQQGIPVERALTTVDLRRAA